MSRAILGFAFAFLLLFPVMSVAEVGIFQRTDCTSISSPEAGKTWCFDQTANALKLWDGTAWVSIVGGQPLPSYSQAGLPAAGTAGRLARVTDDVRGIWMDNGPIWTKRSPVNVLDFVTGGSGTLASPWTGWEAGINALPANIAIWFPSGFYSATVTIITKVGWRIFGDGALGTAILHNAGANPVFRLIADPNGHNELCCLSVLGPSAPGGGGTGTGSAIHLGGSAATTVAGAHRVHHVRLSGLDNMAFIGYAAIGASITESFIQNSKGGILWAANATPTTSNAFVTDAVYISGTNAGGNSAGVEVAANTDGGSLVNGIIESMGWSGIVWRGNNGQINGMRLENNTGTQVQLIGSRNSLRGSSFFGGAGVVKDFDVTGTRNILEGNLFKTGTNTISGVLNVSRNNTYTAPATLSITGNWSYREDDFDGSANQTISSTKIVSAGAQSIGPGTTLTVMSGQVPTGMHVAIMTMRIATLGGDPGGRTGFLRVFNETDGTEVKRLDINLGSRNEVEDGASGGTVIPAGKNWKVEIHNDSTDTAHTLSWTVEMRLVK